MIENEESKQIDKLLAEIQIVFKFKDKTEKSFNKINNLLQNIGLGYLNTMYARLDDCLICCYNVRARILPYPQLKEYLNLSMEYSKFLKSFNIELRNNNLTTDWKNIEKLKEIPQLNIALLLSNLLKNIDPIMLELLLTKITLESDDFSCTVEDLDKLGITDNLELLRVLFTKPFKKLNTEEITEVLRILGDINDSVLLKHLVYIIFKRSNMSHSEIYKRFTGIKGKEPFDRTLLQVLEFEDIETIIKLELFFKNYILKKSIIENVRNISNSNPIDIKVQIPFEIDKLEISDFPNICQTIKEYIGKNRTFILLCFKSVLDSEITKLGIKYDGLLVSYEYSESLIENYKIDKIYYDDLKKLWDDKLEAFRRSTKNGTINEFVILRSSYITNRSKIHFDWSKEFFVRDINYRNIKCKINHNRTYFNELPLEMESLIEIQATLKVKYIYNKKFKTRKIESQFLDVIDIKIIDNFKVIKYNIGTKYGEEMWYENTKEGLSKFVYSNDAIKEHLKILAYPIVLLNKFRQSEKNQMFYEVKCNGSVECKPKKQLIEFLDEENLTVSQSLLPDALRQILRESAKEYNIVTKPMFNAFGVFRKDDELVLAYENDEFKRIIPGNDVQQDLFDKLELLQLDRDGELAKMYYEIIHLNTVSESVRLSTLGISGSAPFSYVIAQKLRYLFPYLFYIGIHGAGKSDMSSVFMNFLYGTEIINSADARSEPRLSKILTQHTFLTNIDDIDEIGDLSMAFLKSYATKRDSTRKRMDNQKMLYEDEYSAVVGSANSNAFLLDDEAFRIRCLVHYMNQKIKKTEENEKALKIYAKNKQIIISSNKVFGFYFLTKAIDYINSLYPEIKSSYQKLIKLIHEIHNKIDTYISYMKLDDKLTDYRRIDVYTFTYFGWLIWKYVFNSKELKSELLDNILDLNATKLRDYILELERSELAINLQVFDNILEFYETYVQNRALFTTVSNIQERNNKILLQMHFVNEYDKWAKVRSYEALGSLKKLAELQSGILNKEIIPRLITVKGNAHISGKKPQEYGVIFYYDEIKTLRNDVAPEEITFYFQNKEEETRYIERFKQLFEEINNKKVEIETVISIISLDLEEPEDNVRKVLELFIKGGSIIKDENKINWKY